MVTMNRLLKKIIPISSFSKNVLTLMTGTTIAQAIPVAISPILTRIYTPEDFGVLALFVSITTIFSTLTTGSYEFAIMLPKEDNKAKSIMALCIFISFFLSSILFLIISFFHSFFVSKLDSFKFSNWLFFIPLVLFLIGLFNALNYYFARKKKFHNVAQANVSKSLGLSISQVFLHFIKEGAFGLIVGRIVSAILAPFFLILKLSKSDKITFNKDQLLTVGKRYIDFPKFSMWAGLFNNLALYFNNLVIPVVFSTTILGFFSLVYRVLVLPLTLISTSVGQVFFKEATGLKNSNMDIYPILWKVVKKMSLISFFGFSVLFFVIEHLFVFVFGEEWRVAGTYAKYLIPMFMIRFVVSPLTITHSIYEAHKSSLLLQLLMFVLSVLCMLAAYGFDFKFEQFLLLYSSVMVLFYLLRFAIILKIIKLSSR